MKPGDLVKAKKMKISIGIVMEIFDDLNEKNPWVRVLFTHPEKRTHWFKFDDLILVTNSEKSGSL